MSEAKKRKNRARKPGPGPMPGALKVTDYRPPARRMPTVGKSYGAERSAADEVTGTLDLEDVKEILESEDFGFTIPEEEQHLCPLPPYVRVCWGEEYGQAQSLRIFVAISELHLSKDINQWDVIDFVEKLGYVCYNTGETAWRKDRWGLHRPEPQKVSAGLPNGKGPMFHSWYYRLPPWMPGLVHEGEPGDYLNGTVALARKEKAKHTDKINKLKDEIHTIKVVEKKTNDPRIIDIEIEIANEEKEVAKWKEEIDTRIKSTLSKMKLTPEEKLKIWGPDAK